MSGVCPRNATPSSPAAWLCKSLILRGDSMSYSGWRRKPVEVPKFKTNKAVTAAAEFWVRWARHVNKDVTESQLSTFKSELLKNIGKPLDHGLYDFCLDGGAWGGKNDERVKIVRDALDAAGIPHFNPGVVCGVSIVSRFSDIRKLTVQAWYGNCGAIIAEVEEEY